MIAKFAALATLLAALLVLAAQNPRPFPVNFLRWHSSAVPLVAVVLAALLAGLLVGFFLAWPSRREPERDDGEEPPPEG
jgi:uncharacterized integral membrane protein